MDCVRRATITIHTTSIRNEPCVDDAPRLVDRFRFREQPEATRIGTAAGCVCSGGADRPLASPPGRRFREHPVPGRGIDRSDSLWSRR